MSTPTVSPQTILVIVLALVFVCFCLGTAAFLIYRCCRARRVQSQAHAPDMVDLEHQVHGINDVKNGSPFLAIPPLAAMSRSWARSTSSFGSDTLGKSTLALPPPVLAVAPSSRLRDSVLCTALGLLTRPAPNDDKIAQSGTVKKSSRRVDDLEAGVADLNNLDPDSTLSYPEWIRPHLSEIREQAKREWALYVPKVHVPAIVISCEEESVPVPDSPASVYSTESCPSELDTPPPMTPTLASPTLASPVSFYFPSSPTFSATDYLQVPPPSYNAPREEEKSVMRNVSNFSGKTFALSAPPSRFSKLGKIRERRILEARVKAQAQAQAKNVAQQDGTQLTIQPTEPQVTKRCGAGPRVSAGLTVGAAHATRGGVTGVGLGLHLRPDCDFQNTSNKTLAASGPPGDDGAQTFPGTFSTTSCLDLASTLEDSDKTCVVSPPLDAYKDDDKALHIDDADDTQRGKRLARLIDTFDSSFSLASIDSGRVKLTDVLEDYHYNYLDETLDAADPDESNVTEVSSPENRTHRSAVVYTERLAAAQVFPDAPLACMRSTGPRRAPPALRNLGTPSPASLLALITLYLAIFCSHISHLPTPTL
ncbi:hypothetical protein BD413DRAFT_490383 [Trametes elegans]|nr:hypothetical protein BD413DRAFT_490383 [Trametes elegans]